MYILPLACDSARLIGVRRYLLDPFIESNEYRQVFESSLSNILKTSGLRAKRTAPFSLKVFAYLLFLVLRLTGREWLEVIGLYS